MGKKRKKAVNDTHPEIDAKFRKMIMLESGERRLLMGCSMFDSARQIVRSSIYNKHPDITESLMKKEIFLRFYGQEFTAADKKKIIAALR